MKPQELAEVAIQARGVLLRKKMQPVSNLVHSAQ